MFGFVVNGFQRVYGLNEADTLTNASGVEAAAAERRGALGRDDLQPAHRKASGGGADLLCLGVAG